MRPEFHFLMLGKNCFFSVTKRFTQPDELPEVGARGFPQHFEEWAPVFGTWMLYSFPAFLWVAWALGLPWHLTKMFAAFESVFSIFGVCNLQGTPLPCSYSDVVRGRVIKHSYYGIPSSQYCPLGYSGRACMQGCAEARLLQYSSRGTGPPQN